MSAPLYSDLAFYSSLGLRCGLEVHRQLDTEHKLFCDCPVKPYRPEYHAEILRHMRPTLSELGEYDPTALMEFKTRKQIVYRLNRDTVCTYEMDDAPPFRLNRDALRRAMILAAMLKLSMVDELHIARKQYLDGSIPTGFQRTLILGVNGHMMCKGRRIGIRQLGLEEEACREVSDRGHTRTYMTDRLSIPLIEVVTEAEARTPVEAADLARVIRKICHLSGVVRTGLGRVRQDVNVSVEGGTRVEIKGVPRIGMIPGLVHYEALRQKALLDLRDRARDRGLEAGAFANDVDLTLEARDLSNLVFSEWLSEGGAVRAVILRGAAGLLAGELGPGRTLASEVADRVRVVACIDRMPNIIHSDDPQAPAALIRQARDKAGAGPEDAVVAVAGPLEDVVTAMGEVKLRMEEALEGIPRETRKALLSGITVFERLLPGPDRMYPDTDMPPIALGPADFEKARNESPESLVDKESAYRESGLSQEQVDLLFNTDQFVLFDEALSRVRLRPTILAYLLVSWRPCLRRAGLGVDRLDADLLARVFGADSCTDMKQKDAARALKEALKENP